MFLPTSSVGRKLLMALTGQIMIIFVIAHVLGNSTIYFGRMINSYAAALHSLPVLLWALRIVLIAAAALHVLVGIVLTLENRKAKPGSYAVRGHISSTLAGRNMIWTGTVIFAFLIFHLLQFTIQVLDPRFSAMRNSDALGRPDVFLMVRQAFRHTGIVAAYLVSVGGLLLHLSHGIQSSFQTWGLNNERTLPSMERAGTVAAVILFLGYAAIPITIIFGIIIR